MPDSSVVLPPGYLTESPIEFFCVCFNIDSWALRGGGQGIRRTGDSDAHPSLKLSKC